MSGSFISRILVLTKCQAYQKWGYYKRLTSLVETFARNLTHKSKNDVDKKTELNKRVVDDTDQDSGFVVNGIFPNGVYDCRQVCCPEDYGPFEVRKTYELDTEGLADVKFGKEMKKKEFSLRRNNVFLNNGSYGAVPRRVFKLLNEYNCEREDHPDLWFRYSVKAHMDKCRQVIADFINADVNNVVLVPNVTTAMSIFISEFPFKEGDAILDNSKTYGSVQLMIEDLTNRLRPGVERIKMKMSFPFSSEDEIVNLYKETLDKHPNVKVAIVDHITSPSSILIPLKKVIELCHSRGVFVFVDAAHSIGQLPLDMADLKADCFTSNLHKWGFTPRGCAVIYFDEKHRSWMRPPIRSWFHYNSVDLQFLDQGCRDHVPLICGRHGVEFIKAIGGVEKISAYTSDLADKATELICKKAGLEKLELPSSLVAPNIRMIRLPPIPGYKFTMENAWFLQKELFGKTNVYGLIFPDQRTWYFRICVTIYNSLSDFDDAANALIPFLEKYCHKSKTESQSQ